MGPLRSPRLGPPQLGTCSKLHHRTTCVRQHWRRDRETDRQQWAAAMATVHCQKCRTPLRLDNSLEDLNPAAYDLLVGECPDRSLAAGAAPNPRRESSYLPCPPGSSHRPWRMSKNIANALQLRRRNSTSSSSHRLRDIYTPKIERGGRSTTRHPRMPAPRRSNVMAAPREATGNFETLPPCRLSSSPSPR